ncbi:MAG: leucine-rich repeat domain-containing protein [Holosporales bacterium]|jgi:hypothetical protein|nr:leucine-rich repeat domain-containing protein [Holosporales bacterium]
MCTNLTSLTIPDSVANLKIGYYAFYDCSSLASLTIPDSVTNLEIGSFAFGNCPNLASLEIPGSVTDPSGIDENAFVGSSLNLVTISDTAHSTLKVLFYNEGINIINSILEAAPPTSGDDDYTLDFSELNPQISFNDLGGLTMESNTRWIIKISNEAEYYWNGENWVQFNDEIESIDDGETKLGNEESESINDESESINDEIDLIDDEIESELSELSDDEE